MLGGGGLVEPVAESASEVEVETEGGAAPVPVNPAAAPATVLPDVPCGVGSDMLVDNVVVSDGETEVEILVKSERVLVASVLFP